MALTDEGTGGNGFFMPVQPAYGGNSNNGGFGFGGDWAWILLLLVLFGGNGWGGGFGGGMFGNDGLYPWMNQSNQISDGFRDQMLGTQINGIQNSITTGFGDVQNSLCNGFAGVNAAITNAQMNNMQNVFSLQSALQNCCCENRAATQDLKYTVATENCADRAAISDGIRDILVNQTSNTQRILDQMCNDKIDAKNEKIADLERQLTAANLAASQIAQTSQITDSIYNRLSTCPVGTVPVFGEQPIFRCNNNNGCGCGCGGGNF